MKVFDFLGEAAKKINGRMMDTFTYDVKKQKKVLNSIPEPMDDWARAYGQYRCRMSCYQNRFLVGMLNLFSLPVLLFYWVKPNSRVIPEKAEAIFFADGKPDNIVQDSLWKRYGKIKRVDVKKEYLSKRERDLFRAFRKRYPFSWHFQLKCLLKMRFYCYQMKASAPKAIIVCAEYSFTSSFLTDYCKRCGVRHIDVMHGELFFMIGQAFFRYDECYVWDEYYVKLLKTLRVPDGQFVIEKPRSMSFAQETDKKTVDYTYYLIDEKGKCLESVVAAMRTLQAKGFSVVLRPHPRWTDVKRVKHLCGNLALEDYNTMTIEDSIRRTRYAIASHSTTLNQAYYNGVGVVIDDISNREHYEGLAAREYIMLSKSHKLLSELLGYDGNNADKRK